MPKCQHPDCNNSSEHGICKGHLDLINREENSAVVCGNCNKLVAVINTDKFLELNVKAKRSKYYFCTKCRSCGGTKEDEKITMEE